MTASQDGTNSGNASAAVLEPGATCWKVVKAERLAVIVDAADYFRALKLAILDARQSVLLIGWDFDMRIPLAPEDPSDVPDTLGDFLGYVARRTPGLRIRVLRWDLSILKMPMRGTLPMAILDLFSGSRVTFRLDHAHPTSACHHQKIVVVDDALAFCGGIDVTLDRRDTPAHKDEDPRRVRPSGEPYGPWHDATVAVSGDAARALGELARARWQTATAEKLAPVGGGANIWPDHLLPHIAGVDVGIARTQPAYRGHTEIREIEALYLRAIASARTTVYIETQYFASQRIADAIASRLRQEDGPEVVVINPSTAAGWLEEEAMGAARAIVVRELARNSPTNRFRVYHPVAEGGTPIYVHAKIMIVDETLLRIGSSNLNNRSLGFDTEADIAVEGTQPDVARFIADQRNRLLAEHLGTSPGAVDETLRATGSLIETIETLRRPGRTLVDYVPPGLNATEEEFARSGLGDPDRPEHMAKAFRKTVRAAARAGGWPRRLRFLSRW